jgi:hypothetical protein
MVKGSVSAGRRHRPCSILIALQDNSGLKLYDKNGDGFIVELRKGDVLIFAGDMPHNGLQSRSGEVNYRLFGYFPTSLSEVPWSTQGCEESRIKVVNHMISFTSDDSGRAKRRKAGEEEEAVAREKRDRLLDATDPMLADFKDELYEKTLYDRGQQTFYHFSDKLWYSGIDTAKVTQDGSNRASRYLTSIPVVARDLYSHCEHFSQDDFWFDYDLPKDGSSKSVCKALLSKYRKDCAYCVVCPLKVNE